MWKLISNTMRQMTRTTPQSLQRRLDKNGVYAEATLHRRILAPTDHLCAITDVGRVRDHNEDTFYLSEDGRHLIVADGMGGYQSGEVASALAVEAVAEFLLGEQREATNVGQERIERLLRKAFEAAHRKVVDANQDGVPGPGMGATLIVACVLGDVLHTCHLGDVRCYLRTKSSFEQITRDHSVVGALVQGGQLTPEQARAHPSKNEVLQAIGMPQGIVPDVNKRPLEHGDRILLCSDGLWEALSDDDICSIVDWEGSMRQRATQLVDRANQAGGLDNITVVLYEHGGSNSQQAAWTGST